MEAKAGNGNAQNHLADLYANGLGVKQDYKKAFELYAEAIKIGNSLAINNLATMYYKGQGILKITKSD